MPPDKVAEVDVPPRADKPAANSTMPNTQPELGKQPPTVVPAEPVATPPAAQANAAEPHSPARSSVEAVPARGTLIWSGDAAKDQTVTIEGGVSSFGSLNGRLPRLPCTLTVSPSDVSIAEAPSPSNGFDRIVLRFRKKARFNVTIAWETLR
jgi:hypothetical protein